MRSEIAGRVQVSQSAFESVKGAIGLGYVVLASFFHLKLQRWPAFSSCCTEEKVLNSVVPVA